MLYKNQFKQTAHRLYLPFCILSEFFNENAISRTRGWLLRHDNTTGAVCGTILRHTQSFREETEVHI